MPDPETSLALLQAHIKPGARPPREAADPWEAPAFEHYEDIRLWLKDSVMSANLFERFPDGRWTIELLLKEQNPGTYRYIVL
jgi:hypothetical protein